MRKQFLNSPAEGLDRTIMQEMIQQAQERFQNLTEEDQILYLLSQRIGGVREYASTYEKQLEFAHAFISFTFGPKFADRVLSDPAALKKLHLDRASFKAYERSTTTVVVPT